MKEIRKIIEAYDCTDFSQEKLALASVVNVEESSYRRIGARMLVSSSGRWVGGISGGCLEGDALKRAQNAIYKGQSSTVTYDTMDDDSNEIGVGLGCNGKLEVLFTPIDHLDSDNAIEKLRKISIHNKACLLLKVIESDDEPTFLAKAIILDLASEEIDFCHIDQNNLLDTIKETRILRRPQIVECINSIGQKLTILLEYIRPELKLYVVGDNYDVLAFIGIAKELGWQITLIGRKKKMSKYLFETAKDVYEYEEVDKLHFDEYSAVVLMSHDYEWDKRILPIILHKSPPYIGMLGPKKRMAKMNEELEDFNLAELQHFHSPVGLDIGAESPEEIALSIAAEIVAVFRKREGGLLKLRQGAIHERI